ncbi:MAG TPA: flagellar basal body-associated FliL family protein [Azonexus sp.]
MIINFNKRKQFIVAFALLGALAAGGAAAWQFLRPAAADGDRPVVDNQVYKYISLDKVIVMLRGRPGEPMSHYMAVDLVFKTPHQHEKITKEHLPMLRSIAVKALSDYTFENAGMMTIDQFAAGINRAYSERYAREQQEKPFAEVMIGKLIIE